MREMIISAVVICKVRNLIYFRKCSNGYRKAHALPNRNGCAAIPVILERFR